MNIIKNFFTNFFQDRLTRYSFWISVSISMVFILEAVYLDFLNFSKVIPELSWIEKALPVFITEDDREFSKGFIEWFGAFYGFLLPLLLVRAWEQFDSADREFDRESDTIRVMHQDIMLLEDDEHFLDFKIETVGQLRQYALHVMTNYETEHLDQDLRDIGNAILQGIRRGYRMLIYRGGGKVATRLEPLTTELLERLNEAIDVRGDRISIFRQRLYESLRYIAIFTSILWLVPFYFLDFDMGFFGASLKLGVTFLIIFVLSVISDLDEPFTGVWVIDKSSWNQILGETTKSLEELREIKSSVAPPSSVQKILKPIKKRHQKPK